MLWCGCVAEAVSLHVCVFGICIYEECAQYVSIARSVHGCTHVCRATDRASVRSDVCTLTRVFM